MITGVAEKLDAYYAALERLGLTDEQITSRDAHPAVDAMPRWQRIVLAPLAASGIALYALPYFIPRLIARRWDPDAVSTIKLGASLIVYPLWAAGLVAGSLVLLPLPLSLVGVAVVLVSPFAALRWLDAWNQRAASVTSDQLGRLARLRAIARTAIDEARQKLPG
ncbi:MAG: hypothetical protein WKG01_08360 [Kofleriaceae bacterium]